MPIRLPSQLLSPQGVHDVNIYCFPIYRTATARNFDRKIRHCSGLRMLCRTHGCMYVIRLHLHSSYVGLQWLLLLPQHIQSLVHSVSYIQYSESAHVLLFFSLHTNLSSRRSTKSYQQSHFWSTPNSCTAT
jgi:hypothetical protein